MSESVSMLKTPSCSSPHRRDRTPLVHSTLEIHVGFLHSLLVETRYSYIYTLAVKISVSPDVKATGSVEAHLIPTINVGISALAGAASANVFLDLYVSFFLSENLGFNSGIMILGTRVPFWPFP